MTKMTATLALAAVVIASCASDDGDDLSTVAEGSSGGGSTSGDDGSGGATTHGDATGEELFASVCAPCHGIDAAGTELGYELRHPVRPYAQWVIRNGRPGDEFEASAMAAYAPDVLGGAELEKIFDYLDSFEQPTTGEGLYLDYCRNCHGIDARGGVVGVDISDKEIGDITEKVREGEGGAGYGNRIAYMPAFDAQTLTDDELTAIADYIATL